MDFKQFQSLIISLVTGKNKWQVKTELEAARKKATNELDKEIYDSTIESIMTWDAENCTFTPPRWVVDELLDRTPTGEEDMTTGDDVEMDGEYEDEDDEDEMKQ